MKPRKQMSVVTLPLRTEAWQADLINKRLELCRRVYNELLRHKMKVIRDLEKDPVYASARREITELYRTLEFVEKDHNFMKKFISPRKTCNSMLEEAGITEYALISDVCEAAKAYPEHLSSNMAIYSIAKPLWAAIDSYLHSEDVTLREKALGEVRSMAADGKSGIRITDADGRTLQRSNRGGTAMHISSSALSLRSA